MNSSTAGAAIERCKIRLLVAMESRMIGDALCAYLNSVPDVHVVARASNKAQILELTSETSPSLAVIEHPVGGHSAVELAAEIHRLCSVGSIVLGDKSAQNLGEARGKPGVIAVVFQEEPIATLAAAIHRALRGGSELSSRPTIPRKRAQDRR